MEENKNINGTCGGGVRDVAVPPIGLTETDSDKLKFPDGFMV